MTRSHRPPPRSEAVEGVTLAEVRAAARALEGVAVRTPLLEVPGLSSLAGAPVALKCENAQPIGAFKIRGAYHAVARMARTGAGEGVVTQSSGNHGQAIWNTAQGRWFHQTNQPGATNRLSLHVEPILVPVSWLYYLYPGPEILFIFQATVVALGAIPVFALARWKLRSEGVAFVFALAYLRFPAIQGATLLDFHAITLAPTFLLAAFYYLETDRLKGFALFAILAVACKEDMTLLVMMMGLYAFIIRRRYRLGLITMGLCLAWAFLAARAEPGSAPWQPAEQAQSDRSQRHRQVDTAPQPKQSRKRKRADAAGRLQDDRHVARVRLAETVQDDQQDHQQQDAKDERAHRYLICAMSLIAPASRRADRSASARRPPAA